MLKRAREREDRKAKRQSKGLQPLETRPGCLLAYLIHNIVYRKRH